MNDERNRTMTDILDVSRALGGVVAASEASLVLVHGGRSGPTTGTAFGGDLVVTAAGRLEREQDVEVTTRDGTAPATFLGADSATGIGLLRVGTTLEPFPLADAAALRVGELVLALARTGRGLGARLGIVSRLGGEWRLPGGARFDRYVETDVTPAPGLAGSALVTVTGELVGVNAVGLARGSLVTLPAASVTRIVDSLVAHGRVRRARLGVALQRVELPRAVAERLGRRHGLVVLSVLEGSPAERGGLVLGDVILAVGGALTERVDELQSALDERAIDVEAPVHVLRAGAEAHLVLKPEARP
jgi:S1-C subfamily serine protease